MMADQALARARRKRWEEKFPEKAAAAKLNWRQAKGRDYHREYQRRQAAIKPDDIAAYKRNIYLKRTYKITLAEYETLLGQQNGRCAICATDDPGRKGRAGKNWMVDHCHDTGKVRGLLCHACNVGIGNFKDDTNIMEKAITYLRKLHINYM